MIENECGRVGIDGSWEVLSSMKAAGSSYSKGVINAMYPKMAGGKKTISLTKVLVKDGNKKSLCLNILRSLLTLSLNFSPTR